MLNNLMHSDQSLTDSSKFVSASRCRKNRLCFLPDSFAVDGDRVMFGHTFDLIRMQQAFPSFEITDTSNLDVVVDLHHGEVEGAFSHGQLFLYDISNICTIRNVYTMQQALMEYGFGMRLASMFLRQFWTEYFVLVGGDFSGCNLETMSFSGDHTPFTVHSQERSCLFEPVSITERLNFLLPLPDRQDCHVNCVRKNLSSYISSDNIDSHWKKFGTRAWYLELFANPLISYDQLAHFHSLVLVSCLYTCKYIPWTFPSKFFVRESGGVVVRKASRFEQQIEELNVSVFDFLQNYSVNNNAACEYLGSVPLPAYKKSRNRGDRDSVATASTENTNPPQKRKMNGRFA
ncbi:uncharacterized protein EV154DRAFT_509591 [Mucor mucedo]|uniref:uncharacterized protein n=1 Tax=Mucor mucedo TaxID=29922 RepID=UPI00221F211D|nr:uncharacterized protein EV154DRAFT_527456 [Mucor mucedo]XP_051457385.1 uncharacterized protein EV154DRAFT_509591 [Mucor mucedo]KAI7874073.1 hypothetical protein EV154DRAFT_527456 [Mucor mucedo]KAI7890969.1 hypothetical protein EV154DRAFT_509591 [Mucor mucedo]